MRHPFCCRPSETGKSACTASRARSRTTSTSPWNGSLSTPSHEASSVSWQPFSPVQYQYRPSIRLHACIDGPCKPCQDMRCDQLSAPQVAGLTCFWLLVLARQLASPCLALQSQSASNVLQGLEVERTVSPAAPGGSGKAPTALQAGCHGCADHMHAGASPMHVQCDAAKYTCAKLGSSCMPADRLLLCGCVTRLGWFHTGKQVIIVIIINLSSTCILWPCRLMLTLQQMGPSHL